MSLISEIDSALSLSGAKWRNPTSSELDNEWKSESSLRNLFGDANGHSLAAKSINDDAHRELFMKAWKSTSSVETFNKPPPGIEYHKAGNLDDLAKKTKYMRKDVSSLANAMREGATLPYPLLAKRGGKYEMLGGRTRFGVAVQLNLPVEALVFDDKKVQKAVAEFVKKSFIENPAKRVISSTIDRAQREMLWNWVEPGMKGNKPFDLIEPFLNHVVFGDDRSLGLAGRIKELYK